MYIRYLNADDPFPSTDIANDELQGLLAFSADLSTKRLILAYQHGIFPWFNTGEPIAWFSPKMRMVITPDTLRISKSLKQSMGKFKVRVDQDFSSVIHTCAKIKRRNQNDTWINDEMINAYQTLHDLGYASSIETYQNEQLVGGLYGVHLGKVFFGESMFHLVTDASKVALVHLLTKLAYQLVDCQIASTHLQSLGAFTLERTQFERRLKSLI